MKKCLFSLIVLLISTASYCEDLPPHYNLIDQGKASFPRGQTWGTCWAFSTIYNLESNLYFNSNWDTFLLEPKRLSSYHMDKFSGFTRQGHDNHVNDTWYSGAGGGYQGSNTDNLKEGLIVHLGGDYHMATAYLANLGGAVTSWSIPDINYGNLPHEKFKAITKESSRYQKYMPHSVEWFNLGENNVEPLKKAILENGAIATLQYMEEEPHLHTHLGKEIHYYGGDKKPNHALNIIGWNDYLALPPLKPGMWIVVDSDHIDSNEMHIGSFYIPYADIYVGSSNEFGPVQFNDVKVVKYKNTYGHALHGWTHTFSQAKSVKNRYRLKGNELIVNVGIYITRESDKLIAHVKDMKGNDICVPKEVMKKRIGFYLIGMKCQAYEGELEVMLSSVSGEYATDGSKLFSLLLRNSSNDLPKEGSPVLVKSKALPRQSFFKRKEKWYDLYSYRWPKLIDEGIDIKRDRTANFSIYLYTADTADSADKSLGEESGDE